MRVMVFAKATEHSEEGVPPTPEAFAAMDKFTEELVEAVLHGGDDLGERGSSRAPMPSGSTATARAAR